MKLSPLFLLLIGTCFPLAIVDGQPTTAECISLAESADCSFYTECVERKIPCGPSGYAVGFGYHFCKAFKKLSGQFTSKGQTWVQNVRKCLINAIRIQYEKGATCEQLRESAFNSHPKCYVDNGFCSDILLSFTNLHGLFNVLSTKISALFSLSSLKQVIDTAARCIVKGIKYALQLIIGAARVLYRLFSDFVKDILDSLSVNCTRDLYVMLVMDSSGSIGKENFEIMKTFVANFINSLNSTNGTKIGVITFSDNPQVVIPLTSTLNITSLATQVQAISYIGGATWTDRALDLMARQLEGANEEGAAPIGILLTDGQSTWSGFTLASATRVHAAGISMYTFGIGDAANPEELQGIASSPFYDYNFYISSFDTIEFDQHVLLLTRQTCSTPESGQFDEASTHALAQGDTAYITYPFDTEKGVTLQYQVEEGSLSVFGSFSVRNPTQSTADFTFVAEVQMTYYVSAEKYNEATGLGMQSNDSLVLQAMSGNTVMQILFLSVSGLNETNNFAITAAPGKANGTFGPVQVTFWIVLMSVLACIMV